MRRIQFILLGLAALGLGLLAAVFLRTGEARDIQSGLLLDQPRPLPAFTLIDQHGAPFSREELLGQWHLLFAGFTRCPDFCPNTLTLTRALRAKMGRAADQWRLLFLSVDPERDTPDVLGPYLASFDPGAVGLTGTDAAISTLARSLGLAYARAPRGDTYDMDHSVALVLIDPQARVAAYFNPPHQLETLASDLSLIMERSQ